jgi:hypothetical protein
MCLTTGYQVTKKLRFITIQAIGKEKHGLKVNQCKLVVRYQQPVPCCHPDPLSQNLYPVATQTCYPRNDSTNVLHSIKIVAEKS